MLISADAVIFDFRLLISDARFCRFHDFLLISIFSPFFRFSSIFSLSHATFAFSLILLFRPLIAFLHFYRRFSLIFRRY